MCDTCGCNVTPANRHLVVNGGELEKTASGREAVEVLEGLHVRAEAIGRHFQRPRDVSHPVVATGDHLQDRKVRGCLVDLPGEQEARFVVQCAARLEDVLCDHVEQRLPVAVVQGHAGLAEVLLDEHIDRDL